ncbi:hypothetical protein WOLCODRAFT_141169 [Wolfiporia cocos MD-104 SS10]|uniref:Uncharacterized protein n=1 Tax=Wolfiporia cocos (strain MD-104) TaxID=742152 RepID=A0A2H3JCH4_WOLCO|nr:hypothetical protein WOLCODRAFT_141169 [Wolfiporia cocos MD-104 SS10]
MPASQLPSLATVSEATSTGSKRSRDGEDDKVSNRDGDGNKVSKRSRVEKKRDGLRKAILAAADSVDTSFQVWGKLLDVIEGSFPNYDVRGARICLVIWENVVVEARNENTVWDDRTCGLLQPRLLVPDDMDEYLKILLEKANATYSAFAEAQIAYLSCRPSPSELAKPNTWSKEQKTWDRFLCLRPAMRRGLPMSTLHTVFGTFQQEVDATLPSNEHANEALRVAALLCASMGESFRDEDARGQMFLRKIGNFFGVGSWTTKFPIEPLADSSGSPGGILFLQFEEKIPGIIREDKWEPGSGGSDAYLQCARDYELLVKYLNEGAGKFAMKETFLRHGAPTLLMSVIGPILIVAGGFYDGKSVTVEPLTRPCLMMEDDTGKRQQELAQVLYASFNAVRAFRGLLETPLSTTYAFGTPRVYPSFCRLDTGRETLLQFEGRLIPVDTSHHLLFSGKCRDPSTLTWDKVAIKLVMNYGSEVHRFLAGHNLAPILYGSVAAVGAPTAYVMSLLGKEWITLFDYRSRLPSDASTFTNAITAGLNKVLEVLESKDYVHGDLRDNNIMILVDAERRPVLGAGQAQLRVIDFDWAGNAGEVQYPAQRNDSIEGWPGRAGGLIEAGHDRQLVKSWWPELLLGQK